MTPKPTKESLDKLEARLARIDPARLREALGKHARAEALDFWRRTSGPQSAAYHASHGGTLEDCEHPVCQMTVSLDSVRAAPETDS